MSGLIFPFKELIDECEIIKAYAGDFLDTTTTNLLDEAKGTLQSWQKSKTAAMTWQIPLERPLMTVWSDGESKPDKKSGHKIRAKFSFIWKVRKLTDAKWKDGHFILDGLASTVTTIADEDEQVIARWAADIGSHDSPGAHLHFQVSRPPDDDVLPFPHSFDVPRFPAPLMSPFLVVEFALGELFQDRWKKHALEDNKHTNRWRSLHQNRLVRFFEWQAKHLKKLSVGSPWISLKVAKPTRELLVEGT